MKRTLIKDAVLHASDYIMANPNCCGVAEWGGFDVEGAGYTSRIAAPTKHSVSKTARSLLNDLEADGWNAADHIGHSFLISSSVVAGSRNTYWWFVRQVMLKLGFKQVNSFVNKNSGRKIYIMHLNCTPSVHKAILKLAGPEEE